LAPNRAAPDTDDPVAGRGAAPFGRCAAGPESKYRKQPHAQWNPRAGAGGGIPEAVAGNGLIGLCILTPAMQRNRIGDRSR